MGSRQRVSPSRSRNSGLEAKNASTRSAFSSRRTEQVTCSRCLRNMRIKSWKLKALKRLNSRARKEIRDHYNPSGDLGACRIDYLLSIGVTFRKVKDDVRFFHDVFKRANRRKK